MSYGDAMKDIGSGYPTSEKFESTGRFIGSLLDDETIDNLVDQLQTPPVGSVYAAYSVYALGGAVARKSPKDTAFFFRNSPYILGVQSVWEEDIYAELNKAWVRGQFKYIEPKTVGSYINFPYSKLKAYEKAYFGGNVKKLTKVKNKYDPLNVFSFPQSLKPYEK